MIERFIFWISSFFKVKSVRCAFQLGLKWQRNVFGDQINQLDCRSLWIDKYGNEYRCDELYQKEKKLNKLSPSGTR